MSNYCAILESYLIDMDGIAEEGAGDTLRKIGNTIKTKVQEMIRFIVKLWNRVKNAIKNIINKSSTTAKNEKKEKQKEIDQQQYAYYRRVGEEIGTIVKAFGKSSEHVYDRCINIITSDMMHYIDKITESERRDDFAATKNAIESLEDSKGEVMEFIKELPNVNGEIDTKLSSLKTAAAFDSLTRGGLRDGFLAVYGDPNHLYSAFNDSYKSKLIETLNKLTDIDSKLGGRYVYLSHAISKVIISTQTVLSSLYSYNNAISKIEDKIFSLAA